MQRKYKKAVGKGVCAVQGNPCLHVKPCVALRGSTRRVGQSYDHARTCI